DGSSRSPKAGNSFAIKTQCWASQRLPLELCVTQSGPDSFLNQRAFKLRHRTNDLKHQPARRRREVKIVTEADKSDTVAVKVCERVDEVLKCAPDAITLQASYTLEAPPVSTGHEAFQFEPRLFGSRHSVINVLREYLPSTP